MDSLIKAKNNPASLITYKNRSLIIPIISFLLFLSLTTLSSYAQDNSKKESIKGNLKIVFIIDTSDSMNKGERFIRVKKAVNEFVNSLIEGDYFVVITFDTKGYLKYSGIVGDEKVRKAILRVFDSNYPDNEPVKGRASKIILGVEKAYREIKETPPYQSTAIVLFTDGDHYPKPSSEEWQSLCQKVIDWKNDPKFKDSRKVFAVDVGDPKNSKIMADDLKVESGDYFPYSEDTDFAKILEKIRSRLPYHFDIKFFPSKMNIGKFHEPGEITANPIFILNNGDFIKKGGYVVPEISVYKDGKKIENPGITTNIPQKIDKEFFTENFSLKFDKKVPPGKYEIKIAFKPEGPLNAKLSLLDEEGKKIENTSVTFETTSWLYNNKSLVVFGLIFLLTLVALYFVLSSMVKGMPEVRGELQCHPEGLDISPCEKKLRIPTKIMIFTHGKNTVSVGRGRGADIRFGEIDFLESEHFEITAESTYSYKVKPLEGRILVLDKRDIESGSRTLKNGYKIKVENPDDPENQYVLFEIKNRDLR